MYPLKFENIYFKKVWGGRDFGLFRSNLPEGRIGESWDVSCHPHGTSIISNGEYRGIRLDELIKDQGERIVGTKISKCHFPLLMKLINARENLSLQVHPDDEFAHKEENEMGKTEAWYVIDAFEGASLILGMKDCSKEQLRAAIEDGKPEKYMNKILAKKGDVYLIKSGLIHAIGSGVIIAEIQQNSDTTYRVYDYNRGRELHIDKAMEVADLNLTAHKCKGIKVKYNGYSKISYCSCDKFTLELYDIESYAIESSSSEKFYIFTCVDGFGNIIYSDDSEEIRKGDSVLIPASLGKYKIEGKIKLIKNYVT